MIVLPNGKTYVDNTGCSPADRSTITRTLHYIRRMDDPVFAEAIRLAARADSTIEGGQTALEQISRSSSLVTRGAIAAHNRASRVLQSPGAICG